MKLHGPIFIFGAGGFIGVNLLNSILKYRKDVYGISQDPVNNWRFIATHVPKANLVPCDIREKTQLDLILTKYNPKTIFNLAAYGAYSKQNEYEKIYNTNFNATLGLVESLKKVGFDSYVQAGSSSEYGINCSAPLEDDSLIPNSHYAVSKVAMSFAAKYYGSIEKLPVAHLRLYSAYGPWEEPDRLIPRLLSMSRKGKYPPLVNPLISRDFIYVNDISVAFIRVAGQIKHVKGDVFNIGTGQKTSIKQLTRIVRDICKIDTVPNFGTMKNRKWDVTDWYSNVEKASKVLKWKPLLGLKEGIRLTLDWQRSVGYDEAFWNWTKK